MNNTILGTDVVAQIEIDGEWFPVFCAKSVSLNVNQGEIETTDVNAANARSFLPGISDSTVNVSGVTELNNDEGRVSIFYLLQSSIRRQIFPWRIIFENQDGDTQTVSFDAFLLNGLVDGTVSQFSQSNITYRVTGEFQFSEIVPPPSAPICEVEDPLYKTVVAGQNSVSDSLLTQSGVEILEVQREGLGQVQTTGTPGNREFRFIAGTGTIEFSSSIPFEAGEIIYILYKITT